MYIVQYPEYEVLNVEQFQSKHFKRGRGSGLEEGEVLVSTELDDYFSLAIVDMGKNAVCLNGDFQSAF